MTNFTGILRITASHFILGGILLIPYPLHLFSWWASFTGVMEGRITAFVARVLFGLEITPFVSSDSVAMYLLMLILLLLSVAAAIGIKLIGKEIPEKYFRMIRLVAVYFLALVLLKYGIDKICKGQFYLPEPNILFTKFGELDKDILFWSTMGTSYSYNIFMGSAEVLAALLILMRRTRILGLLIATAIMVNVVAVNFGFDISVKLFSCFLLSVCLFLIWPYVDPMYRFLFRRTITVLPHEPVIPGKPHIRTMIHVFIIGVFLLEACYPYLHSGSWNDDVAARPHLHGAYEVNFAMDVKEDTVVCVSPVKRFFIHRNGYFILQDTTEKMIDYRIKYEDNNGLFAEGHRQRLDIQYSFLSGNKGIKLALNLNNTRIQLHAQRIPLEQLPALHGGFHWFSDR